MAKLVTPDWGSQDEGSSDYESSVGVFEVDRILAERKVDGVTQYLVKWQNYEEKDCTWEPADSFDTSITISLWERARDQGDTLDASELQELEQKMARPLAGKEEEEEAPCQERIANKPARKTDSDLLGATERTAITNDTLTRRIATPPVPSFVPGKRKASPSILPKSNAESVKPFGAIAPPPIATSSQSPPIPTISQAAPANPNQTFHALSSDSRQTGRRTTKNHGVPASSFREGQLYHSLSHQNNANKLRRQEPAPNMTQISTLRPLTELLPVHDVALNLPSGPRPLQHARNPTQEVFVESIDGDLERQPEPAAAFMSPSRSTPGSAGLEGRRTEPPLHQQISHSVSQSAPQPGQSLLSIRYGGSYFYYKWGELVVQIRVGMRVIGHVKIVGLSRPGQDASPLIAAILRTRESPVLGMTFEQEDADNLQDYRSFEHEVRASGSLEPYDNAKEPFYELLAFFNIHSKVAAVWRHDSVPWIMIAYSSRAAAFVEKGFPSVSGGLAFIVCRKVPWRSTPPPSARIQPSSRTEDTDMLLDNGFDDLGIGIPTNIVSGPISAPPVEANDVSEPMTGLEPMVSNAQTIDKMVVLDPRRTKATNEIPTSKKQPETEKAKTEEVPFEKKYGITYENLTRVPSTVKSLSENSKFNRRIVSVFLAFANDKKREEAVLKNWLTTRTPAYRIYSSSEDHSWERYKLALQVGDHVGIILIHNDFLLEAFQIMKGLFNQIRRENIQIFRVSLERPMEDPSRRHFRRIFPSGLVVLVTEATIFDEPKGTADLFNWFTDKVKVRPNWRLFLRPQPQDYLRDLCETDITKEKRASYEKSLILLQSLQIQPSTTSPPLTSPYDDAESFSCVLAPLSLLVFSNGDDGSSLVTSNTKKIAERDTKLVNFFCGWAFDQVSNFRRFVAITACASEDIKRRNSHIDFLTLADFEKTHMLKKNPAKLRTPGDSPMSPVANIALLRKT